MKRISKAVLLGGLAFTLAIGVVPAQVNEIIRGAVNGVPSDIFSCGRGNSPCDLGYKMYCELEPSDVSGAANPVDGIPKYVRVDDRYTSDAQITGNYPVCGPAGAGKSWYILWDGQLGGGTSAHAGWYGAQAQRVVSLEIGNSLSFNCLPVTSGEACFAALDDLAQSNDTILRDGSPLNHVGGISPVPVPQFEARIDSIAAVFERVVNKTVLDDAGDPIDTIDLLWMTDDGNATDADWAANGQILATLPGDATEFKMLRGDDFIRDGKNFMLATRINYVGDHHSFISANSGTFNELQDLEFVDDDGGGGAAAAAAGGDAPAIVNIERIGFSVRKDDFGKEFLIILLDIEGAPAGQVLTPSVKYQITMNTPGGGRSNRQVRANALTGSQIRGGGATVLRFNTNWDNTGDADGLVSENSTFDEDIERGWIIFGIPLNELVDAFNGTGSITGEPGTRVVTFSGSARVPGALDTFPNVDGETISFTF